MKHDNSGGIPQQKQTSPRTGAAIKPVLTQTDSNTTLWIGHSQTDPADHYGGQTFVCPAEGRLDNIQLFATAVPVAGELLLTLHAFDTKQRSWGPVLAQTSRLVNADDRNNWLSFSMPDIALEKGLCYGFRIQARKGLVALAEAACDNKHPFGFGQEWSADSLNQQGHYYSFFSLAFKVEMRA